MNNSFTRPLSPSSLKVCTWNLRSILNKRIELETLIMNHNPDIICLSETWLTPENPNWELKGFTTFRHDRCYTRGGGSLILCKKELISSRMNIENWCTDNFEMTVVGIQTTIGKIAVASIYIAPNKQINIESWNRLFMQLTRFPHIIITGDFNSHSPLWGHDNYNFNDTSLTDTLSDFPLIITNDDTPTYHIIHTGYSSVLDLVIVSASLFSATKTTVLDDAYSSDHFPIITDFDIIPSFSVSNSTRFNTSKMNWILFHEKMNNISVELLHEIEVGLISPDIHTYCKFIENIEKSIVESGGFKPTNKGRKKGKTKPIWWNDECTLAIEKRSNARKIYFQNQTPEALTQYIRIDNEIKFFLRKQKQESYKKFCNTINPSMGLKRIWSVVKGFQSRNSHCSTYIYNDPNLPEIFSLKQELLYSDVLPVNIPYNINPDENNSLNHPFTPEDLQLSLNSCKRDTAPGRDSITYPILKKLPITARKLLLEIFNFFFKNSTFPEPFPPSIWIQKGKIIH